MYSSAVIAVATLFAVIHAAPAPQATTTTGPPSARTTNFGIVLHAAEPYNGLVLRAEASDADANARNLLFERPSAFSPSPAYLSGTAEQIDPSTSTFAYLNFVNECKDPKDDFGAYLPDVGDGRGFTFSIGAESGLANAAWQIGSGQLFGQLRAAPNMFLACNTTVNSTHTPAFGLSWGNMNSNGSFAYGCVPAFLRVVDLPERY